MSSEGLDKTWELRLLWAMRAGKEGWGKDNSVQGPALVCTYLKSISLLLDNSLSHPQGRFQQFNKSEKSKLF